MTSKVKIKHKSNGKVSVTDFHTGAKLTYTPGDGPIDVDPNAVVWMQMALAMYRELTYCNDLTVVVHDGMDGPVVIEAP